MVTYSLRPAYNPGDIAISFQQIIDYLLTFVGEIIVHKENKKNALVSFTETNQFAALSIEKNQTITLTCKAEDSVWVNLIRNVTKDIGLRIYNNQTKSFLLNDPNILEVATTGLDLKISKIFKNYKLEQYFQYQGSFVFFAKDEKGQMHLVNRHILEYLNDHPTEKASPEDFSVVVAPDIGRFVALFDRGLIPISFYKTVSSDSRITNLSGFDIDPFNRDTFIELIYFNLDSLSQSFTQGPTTGLILAKKGESLLKIMKLKNYLAIKVGQDVGFEKKGSNLIPKLIISVFLD